MYKRLAIQIAVMPAIGWAVACPAQTALNPEAIFEETWRNETLSSASVARNDPLNTAPFRLHAEVLHDRGRSDWSESVEREFRKQIAFFPKLTALMAYSRMTCRIRVCEIVLVNTRGRDLTSAEGGLAFNMLSKAVMGTAEFADAEFVLGKVKPVHQPKGEGLLAYIHK